MEFLWDADTASTMNAKWQCKYFAGSHCVNVPGTWTNYFLPFIKN